MAADLDFAKALIWTRAIIYSYSLGLRAHEIRLPVNQFIAMKRRIAGSWHKLLRFFNIRAIRAGVSFILSFRVCSQRAAFIRYYVW